MVQIRILLRAIFLLGTVAAGVGWIVERWYSENLPPQYLQLMLWVAIAGHAMQVIAVYGLLITPDEGDQNGSHGAGIQ